MADGVRSVHPKALPNHQRAVIPENKLLRYALDPTHPRGRHKAVVFNTAEVVVTWIVKEGTDYPSLDSTWVR